MGYEFGRASAVEVVGDNQVLLCPLGKLPRDGPLPLRRFVGVAKSAKLFEEGFDLMVKQTPQCFVFWWGCRHFALLDCHGCHSGEAI